MPSQKQAIANLDYYLDSWKDLAHGLHGYIIDPMKSQLAVISPDSVSQAALILAHLNLFEKTKDKNYLEKAMKEAEWLIANYIWETGFFKNSCFYHKPASSEAYTTLFGNAYASIALAKLCQALEEEKINNARFFNVLKNNFDRFLIAKCWDSKKTFLEFSYKEKLFNPASAATAIRAVTEFSSLTKNNSLIEQYCIPTAQQIFEHKSKNNLFPINEKNNVCPLFNSALVLKGLNELYKKKKDQGLFSMIKKTADSLNSNIHSKENLFYYGCLENNQIKYPLLIAQSAVIASSIKQITSKEVKSEKANEVLSNLYSLQNSNGSFSSFKSYSKILPLKKQKKNRFPKWQDVTPCPCWNAFALEFLSALLTTNPNMPLPNASFPSDYNSKKYSVKERDSTIVIFSKNGALSAKWFKKHDTWLFGKLLTAKRPKKFAKTPEKEKPKKARKKPKAKKKPVETAEKPAEKPPEEKEKPKSVLGFFFKK